MQEFAAEVATHRPMLLRISRQRLRNDAWAEDAVSETMLAALERPKSFAGRAKLGTWLSGILKHKVVDQIRRHTRECQVEGVDDDEPEFGELADAASDAALEAHAHWGNPQELMIRRQLLDQLSTSLKALPAGQARAFMLHDWMGEDTADICEQLGVTSNNLYVMLHRARGRLRVLLRGQWAAALDTPRLQALC